MFWNILVSGETDSYDQFTTVREASVTTKQTRYDGNKQEKSIKGNKKTITIKMMFK